MKLSLLDSGTSEVQGNAHEVFEHARREPIYQFTNVENKAYYEKVLRTPNTDFSGGAYEDLFVFPDMKPFLEAKKLLEKSGLIEKISKKTTNVNRRRRSLSEYDGEWDLSRQWEIQPFAHAKRTDVPNKIVEIECHLNANCTVNSSDISKYGCMVWAINDILEKCGIGTYINFVTESMGTDRYRKYTVKNILSLKKPGEYTNPVSLAKCLTSNFQRRLMFSWFIIACDFADTVASQGLGIPKRCNDTIKFENGKLIITSEMIRESSDKDIQAEVVKAILGVNK